VILAPTRLRFFVEKMSEQFYGISFLSACLLVDSLVAGDYTFVFVLLSEQEIPLRVVNVRE